jgi:hypothetical protein
MPNQAKSSATLNATEQSTDNNSDIKASKHVINVVIPRDRLNDFRYIQLQLLDTKCNALDYISKKLGVPMSSLVKKYIPELNTLFHSELYAKYSIDRPDNEVSEHNDDEDDYE